MKLRMSADEVQQEPWLSGRSIARRAGWGVGDQALSSATNFVLGAVVARQLAPQFFGAYALAFSVFLLGLGVSRSLGTSPLVSRYSAAKQEEWRAGAGRATGTALAVGLAAGSTILIVQFFVPFPLNQALTALAILMPGLLLQDAWRYSFLTKGTPRAAFANDLIFALILFPGAGLLVAFHAASLVTLIGIWGASATVAAAVGTAQSRLVPQVSKSIPWIRAQRDLALSYLIDFMLLGGIRQLTYFGIAAVLSLTLVGGFRAAEILLGPATAFAFGVSIVAVPEGVRQLQTSPERLLRGCKYVSAILAGVPLAWYLALRLTPDVLGETVMGTAWQTAQPVLLPMSIVLASLGVTLGASAGLRALAAGKGIVKARIAVSLMSPIVTLLGAEAIGIRGAAWGLALGEAFGTVIYWRQFLKSLRDYLVDRQPTGSRRITDEARRLIPPINSAVDVSQEAAPSSTSPSTMSGK